MTVIMGINLSDRVYISGDSRLSYEMNGETHVRHDNMQKVEILPGTKHITIASAGDAKFAQYIIHQLSGADFIKDGIAAIRDKVNDWLGPVVDRYFTVNGYTSATFILGGTDSNANKIINGRKWKDMANAYTGGQGAVFVKDAINKAVGPGVPIPDGDITLDIDDTKLFSVRVSQQRGIEIFDAQWGEFLVYGPPGLVKEDIELKHIGEFELGVPTNSKSHEGDDMALLNGIILSEADKYNLGSVGGSVFTIQNNCDGLTYVVTGAVQMYKITELEALKSGQSLAARTVSEITAENNRFYRVINGTKHRLEPVSKYKPGGRKGKMLL